MFAYAAPPPRPVLVTMDDGARWRLDASRASVRLRTKTAKVVRVRFSALNNGDDVHDLTIRRPDGTIVATLAPVDPHRQGEPTPAIVVKLRRGTYTLFCSIGTHEALGMKDTFVVRRFKKPTR